MSAFTTRVVSPLDLSLDLENPRFIIPDKGASEADVIHYLLEHEKILELCKGMNRVGTILPGERIVICDEDNKQVVLEGNRRICCCKLLLNQSLVPDGYRIPEISDIAKSNLSTIQVDVVPSREEAKKYLAARHINRVREWSTLAQMNFVYEEFASGKNVDEIEETSSLEKATINRFLRNANLLITGINSGNWTLEEKSRLSLNHIQNPDRFFRIMGTKGTKALQIYYDNSFSPHSYYLKDKDLNEILSILVRGALIDGSITTRMNYDNTDVQNLIKPIISKYNTIQNPVNKPNNPSPNNESNKGGTPPQTDPQGSQTNVQPDPESHDSNVQNENDHQPGGSPKGDEQHDGPVRPIKNLPLFSTLQCHVDNTNQEYRGLIFIYNEIVRFSKLNCAKNFPIAAVMLTRSLIEHVMINYAKKFGKWEQLVIDAHGSENVKLSKIIQCFLGNKDKIFADTTVRELFEYLFSERINGKINPVNKMNWVVHQLEAYRMSYDELQNIVDGGLLKVIQYMIDQL